MAIYVLVHGSFSGGFQWREVAIRLRAAGHEVYTPTLTGLGERSHLAQPEIDLDTHIQDIVNVLIFEELHDVILTGHSYGGMVISGVAELIPERLAHLVYLDAFVPHDGDSAWTLAANAVPPAALESIEQMVKTTGAGWRWPAPAKSSDGRDSPKDRPQPIKTMRQPLRIANPATVRLPRTFIYCTNNLPDWSARPITAMMAERARADGMRYLELPTSHALMETMPDEVTAILLEARLA
jgi:pimeloyl-ACP methyl ester carboxylesterase